MFHLSHYVFHHLPLLLRVLLFWVSFCSVALFAHRVFVIWHSLPWLFVILGIFLNLWPSWLFKFPSILLFVPPWLGSLPFVIFSSIFVVLFFAPLLSLQAIIILFHPIFVFLSLLLLLFDSQDVSIYPFLQQGVLGRALLIVASPFPVDIVLLDVVFRLLCSSFQFGLFLFPCFPPGFKAAFACLVQFASLVLLVPLVHATFANAILILWLFVHVASSLLD
jgi:hypothetical protein